MAGFTNYLEDKVIGHLFGGTAYTAPTTWYAGLQELHKRLIQQL